MCEIPKTSATQAVSGDPVVEAVQEPVQTDANNMVTGKRSPIKELPNSIPTIPTIEIDPSPSTVADGDDKTLTSPPRKSARLSAKRRLSESIDSPIVRSEPPIVRSESPFPRRRSARRNSNVSQLYEATKTDGLNVTLLTIDETQTFEDTTEQATKAGETAEESSNESKLDKSEEDVDELASAFILEFVEEFVDGE